MNITFIRAPTSTPDSRISGGTCTGTTVPPSSRASRTSSPGTSVTSTTVPRTKSDPTAVTGSEPISVASLGHSLTSPIAVPMRSGTTRAASTQRARRVAVSDRPRGPLWCA